jgi:DNA (cytosine-5)-methyltransferase 1
MPLGCTRTPAVALPIDPTFIIDNVGGQAEYAKASEVNGTLRAGAQGLVAYAVETHPADSRVNIDESGKVQTLTSRMGTGGGNVPMVMEQTPFCKSGRARSADDATTWKEGKVANTLNTFDQGETRANELVVAFAQNQRDEVRDLGDKAGAVQAQPGMRQQTFIAEPVVPIHDQATRFSGKRGDKADGKGNGLGVGDPGDPMNTLTSGDRHAVAFAEPTTVEGEKIAGTLMARDYKGLGRWDTVSRIVCSNYIVRRLTPTECARLQGFADRWGWIEEKKALTEEEYKFWLEVRNTHARINGKKEQEYTAKQMLTWYNKLWTDSAEYKMWGNGIALPTALFCIANMAEVLARPVVVEDDDSWML